MSEEKKDIAKVTPSADDDKELSELLDSALEDFGDGSKKLTTEKSKETKKEDDKKTEESSDVLPETEWSEDFIRQAVEKFESSISNIMKDGVMPNLSTEELQRSFQQMAEAATQVGTNTNVEETGDADFANTISQALRGLTEGAEGLPAAFNEESIMNMFGQNQGQENSFLPFMQGMMENLLSKEVLYPSLKDIATKYPGWLESNRDSITPEERQKYEQQYLLMKDICTQFENEKADDTPDQKKKQYETVLDLMQKMQDFGQPPAELVGDISNGSLPFDPQGHPDMNQCSLM